VGSNWSGGQVPGSGDDVTINTGSAATVTIKSGDSETVHSLTTGSNDTLSITGGSLTTTAPTATTSTLSTLSGPLDMTAGSLEAHGSVTVTVNGSSSVDGGSFLAYSGGVLNLPMVTSYTGPRDSTPYIEAGDTGSQINLPNLTTLGGSFNGNQVYVHAYGGAMIDMHQLPQVTSGAVYFQAQNSSSTIDLAALTSFKATSSNAGLESDLGATLDIGNLTTLDSVAVTIGGPASVAQITSITNGSVGARPPAHQTRVGRQNDAPRQSCFLSGNSDPARPHRPQYFGKRRRLEPRRSVPTIRFDQVLASGSQPLSQYLARCRTLS
jgi:hypothetical protein